MGNLFVGIKKVLQFLVEGRVRAAYPFKLHRGMLFFLVTVMREDRRQFRVLAGVVTYNSLPGFFFQQASLGKIVDTSLAIIGHGHK